MPGTRHSAARSSVDERPADGVGRVDGEHRLRQARADAGRGLQQLEQRALVVVGEAVEREAVLAHDQRGREQRPAPPPAAGRGCRRWCAAASPTPPTPHDDAVGGERGDRALDAGDHRRAPATAAREPGLRGRPPQVADGQRERVGGVGGLRRPVEPEQPGDHRADLVLVGAAAAGDRGLHLRRRVQHDRQAAPGGADDRHRAGLRGAHDGADVGLREDPLDGDRVGRGAGRASASKAASRATSRGAELVGRRACATTPTSTRLGPPGHALDHAEPAPGQAGVDAQHPHRRTSRSPNTSSGGAYGRGRPRRREARPSADALEHLVADVEVGPDVLHVVEVLEGVDEARAP